LPKVLSKRNEITSTFQYN